MPRRSCDGAGLLGAFRAAVAGGALTIRMHLRVAQGLPIAEVARQVDLADSGTDVA
jgi:hypothetical protein